MARRTTTPGWRSAVGRTSSGQQRHPQAGGDQPQHRDVVVRGVGDRRREPAGGPRAEQVAAAARAARDPRLAGEVAEVELGSPGGRVVRREGDHRRVVEQVAGHQAREVVLAPPELDARVGERQRDVGRPRADRLQRLGRLRLVERDREAGVPRAQVRERAGHDRRGRRRERDQPHPPGPQARQRRDLGVRRAQRRADRRAVPGQHLTGLGEPDRPARAVQQRGAQPPLEPAHVLADRGLAVPEQRGGAGDRAGVGDRAQHPQRPDLEPAPPPQRPRIRSPGRPMRGRPGASPRRPQIRSS